MAATRLLLVMADEDPKAWLDKRITEMEPRIAKLSREIALDNAQTWALYDLVVNHPDDYAALMFVTMLQHLLVNDEWPSVYPHQYSLWGYPLKPSDRLCKPR